MPGAQGWHAPAVLLRNAPAGHCWQPVPLAKLNEPAPHDVHVVELALAAYVPLAHG